MYSDLAIFFCPPILLMMEVHGIGCLSRNQTSSPMIVTPTPRITDCRLSMLDTISYSDNGHVRPSK